MTKAWTGQVVTAITFLMLIAVNIPASANEGDVFAIRNIAIDREAETASIARDQALADGRLAAYKRLRDRLTLAEDTATLPLAAPEDVVSLIRDFSLDNEKTSPTRYIARMTVRFEPEAVRSHFQKLGISFSETLSKPVLIVPVSRFAGVLSLWDEPNPWREAWANLEFKRGLVPLSVPVGDLSDLGTINAAQAVSGQEDLLFALADNYGAEEAVVALAEPVTGTAGVSRIDVTLVRHSRVLPARTVVDSFSIAPGEDEFALYSRASAALATRIEDDWKRDTRLDFSARQELYAAVPITGLKEFVSIRNRLDRSAPVRAADVMTLSKEHAEIRLTFLGALDQLQLALAQSDLVLRDELGEWVLRDAKRLPPLPDSMVSGPQLIAPDQPATVIIGGEPQTETLPAPGLGGGALQ